MDASVIDQHRLADLNVSVGADTPTVDLARAVPAGRANCETYSRRRLALLLLIAALATVPILASAFHVAPGWVPAGDDAIIALRGDDLLTSHTPLVGMPSTVSERVGDPVHHPGPLEFQLIGVMSLLNGSPRAPLIAVMMASVASALAVLYWSYRLGGESLFGWAALVLSAMCWSLRGPILVTPWNPYSAILPYLACLVAFLAFMDGRRWALTTAVLFGSWAAQAHLATTGLVMAAAVVALIPRLPWRRMRGRRQPGPRLRRHVAPYLVAAAALLACWAFPLLDVLLHRGGNVGALLAASGTLTDGLGYKRALDIVIQGISPRPVWAQAGTDAWDLLGPVSALEYAWAMSLALISTIIVIRCRGSRPVICGAIVLATATVLTAIVLTAKVPSFYLNSLALHNYLWLWPVSAFIFTSVGAGLVHGARSLPQLRRVGRVPALGAALIGLVVLASASVLPPHRPLGDASSTYLRALSPQASRALSKRDGYVVSLGSSFTVDPVSAGLVFSLERHGHEMFVAPAYEESFGRQRTDRTNGERARLVVTASRAPLDVLPDRSVVVARYEPDPELLVRRDRVEQALIKTIERRGGLTLANGSVIDAADARQFVESGRYIDHHNFRLLDPDLAALPETDELSDISLEPISFVTVLLEAPAAERPPGRAGR